MAAQPLKLSGRIWIESPEGPLIGKGRIELLEHILELGSIRQAAIQMNLSYRQAWQMIDHMNTYCEAPVVISHRGGKGGGSAEVTEAGMQAIQQFHHFQQLFSAFLEKHSQEIKL